MVKGEKTLHFFYKSNQFGIYAFAQLQQQFGYQIDFFDCKFELAKNGI